jgi:N-acetyl sugar amidotransferase
MPSTRPRLEFDENGVCTACHYHAHKHEIDWASRQKEFLKLADEHRGNGDYDCIVPWSGGKDSSAVALHLKRDYGMNPLLVTYSPLLPTEVGNHNREAMCRAGFDNVYFRVNQDASRKLARRFFEERGNPEVHRAAGINAIPVQEAVNRGIKLVVFAEHGETEYGGHILSEDHRKFRYLDEVIEHQIGDHPLNWVGDGISEQDLAPYLYPDDVSGVCVTYFGAWHPWDIRKNFDYVRELIDFRLCAAGRSDGTFTNYDSLDDKIDDIYFHLQHVKFGFGRALRDAARLIQNGHMTRAAALEQVRKFDGEFPKTFLDDVLDYLDMNEQEFRDVIDLHRNDELWEKQSQGWQLRNPPQ